MSKGNRRQENDRANPNEEQAYDEKAYRRARARIDAMQDDQWEDGVYEDGYDDLEMDMYDAGYDGEDYYDDDIDYNASYDAMADSAAMGEYDKKRKKTKQSHAKERKRSANRQKTSTRFGTQVRQRKWADALITVVALLATIVLIIVMVLNVPIIRYEKTTGNITTTQQVSVLKYWKLWQPLVEQEGELSKASYDSTVDLNLKEDLEEDYTDGLDLDQIIEGQYTILFLGMDESGDLSDVNWIFQFDLIAGTLNILQIPRDSYMPDYASYSTAKFNSIYSSGQETGVTPIQRVVNAIEDCFCMYIDCYVKLDCEDIANIVDSIGGIPITLSEEIVYEADKVLPAGEQVLTGEQSEWFIRFRHGYDEGDIGRVKAQRIFLAAMMEKMLDMSQIELYSVMTEIYNNKWIATDLSLEQISMIADFASERLTLDYVNVFMVPGEGAYYYPGDGSAQSVYSIHKSATVDLLNGYFHPYQNEIYVDESAIVELVPEGSYLSTVYDDTQETLEDINKGDTDDGAQ